MDTSCPRDPWLEEQIEEYRSGNAASAAFYQQAVSLLSAHQLLASNYASRRWRLRSLGQLLRGPFRRLYRGDRRASREPPAVLEGVVMPVTNEIDVKSITVIVIDVQHQTKGE